MLSEHTKNNYIEAQRAENLKKQLELEILETAMKEVIDLVEERAKEFNSNRVHFTDQELYSSIQFFKTRQKEENFEEAVREFFATLLEEREENQRGDVFWVTPVFEKVEYKKEEGFLFIIENHLFEEYIKKDSE